MLFATLVALTSMQAVEPPRMDRQQVRQTTDAIATQYDSDGDDMLDRDELLEWQRWFHAETARRGNPETPDEQVRIHTDQFLGEADTDEDGKLSKDELYVAQIAALEKFDMVD